jgi:DNA-binding winged helix-turn-helix (wHTH) protein/TolB-like protein
MRLFSDKRFPEVDMKEQDECLYDFGSFRMNALKRQLLRGGEVVPLASKAFNTLLILVRRHGETVTKDELMDAVWCDTAVEENNLTQQISTLRKRLGEHAGENSFIATIPGQGYSFIAPVKKTFFEDEIFFEEITKSSITIDICDEPAKNQLPNRQAPAWHLHLSEALLGCILMTLVVIASFMIENRKSNLMLTGATRSIAVLDFRALDHNEKSNFHSSGITRTLTAKIGNLESLVLRPVGSSEKFIGQERDFIEVGRELAADVVLEGSVQNDGELVRVAVVAWDTKNNRQIWGDVFTKNASDAFGFQDEISEKIISAIQKRLLN